ncbi:MAG: Coenzyme F420 hydrogenase/dehydrogenase, beta subunit C-terminal domain [Methanolobus sp.]|nr:Coenzyme F420 hydrogenase/dehydrogenase, beta subunit C-terminal domain [Methanolobus sp.]
MPIDPICKNTVLHDSQYSTEYAGEKYYFCCPHCKSKFDEMKRGAIRLRRSLKDHERISFGKLRKEIIKPGICTLCGACASTCESIAIEDGQPRLVGKCTAYGVCYNQCPRTITTEEGLIGNIRQTYGARTHIKGLKGQDGAVVTSMLAYALEEGLIDCAIVTVRSGEEPWKPLPMVATTYEELVQSAGSIYSHSMTLEALMSAIKQGMRSIAFVGPSCNIDAVHKMQKSPYGFLHLFMRANILKMGLFCMDTFRYEGIREFVEKKDMKPEDIDFMKIRKGKFEFHIKDEIRSFDLSDFNSYRSSSCRYCTDMAAENADISCGGVGTPDGWSTVLARSGIGYEIFNEAVDSGYIKSRVLEKKEMERILNLARMKKVQMYGISKRKEL